jgi:hypothetical protein
LEIENDQLKAKVEAQSRLVANGGYMAFASCLKQVQFLNPGVQLTFKGVHPFQGVEGGVNFWIMTTTPQPMSTLMTPS